MNNFNIVLFNEKEDKWTNKTVEAITFAEAAREAYRIRNKKGFDWKIQSVVITAKEALE